MKEKIKITPRARRLARERGIDLAGTSIQGTGFQGGVTEKDLLAWIGAGDVLHPVNAPVSVAGAGTGCVRATSLARRMAAADGIALADISGSGSFGKIISADVRAAASVSERAAAAGASVRAGDEAIGTTPDGKRIAKITPYAGVRKIIGDRLSESMFTAPHVYFTQKADLADLMKLRALVNAKQDKKTSVTDFIARATVMTLQSYPQMNASLTKDGIEEYASVNLGIAVAAPGGLIVPVIKEAQKLSVVGISVGSGVLFDRARDGKLRPDEYTGGTFTISNLGMFGIENFTAIINPPEVGILAVSATKDEAVVVTDATGAKQVAIRPMMNITLSVDHRVIDGLLAAQFVTEIKRLLESPLELMIRDWE